MQFLAAVNSVLEKILKKIYFEKPICELQVKQT